MTLSTLINRPCTIVQRSASGETDIYGDAVPGETRVDAVCELQQTRRDEPDAQQGGLADTVWTAFLLPEAQIDSGDRLVVDGVEYEVVGDPWVARNPRAQADSHIEVTLERTAGSEDAS